MQIECKLVDNKRQVKNVNSTFVKLAVSVVRDVEIT